MVNYFKLLGLSPTAVIDMQLLDDKYKALAAEKHPDQGGDEQEFNQLNTAYNSLRLPSSRLKHLLDIHSISYDKRGTVSNHLMNFFMSTGELIQLADVMIKKKQSATSALSKALLEADILEIQERLSEQIDQLEQAQTDTLESIPEAIDASKYETASRDLAFLEKWQAQLRERYASLF